MSSQSQRIRFAALFFCCFLAFPVMGQRTPIKDSALQQMAYLTAMKNARTPAQTKIASSLLYEAASRNAVFRAALPAFESRLDIGADDRVLVDLNSQVSPAVLDRINQLGGEVINAHARFDAIRADMPLASLEALAELAEVRHIQPAARFVNRVTTEGDTSHAADTARATFGVDGTGVRVGVISDSVEELAALQGTGELPPGVTVLPGQAGTGLSEGTALMEIIHDMAPGAELFFATAAGGKAQFAQNILDLQAAGCDIIVDDIIYLNEAVYQDDVIAQAVETVHAQGTLYFSAAGNEGNLSSGNSGTWEGAYSGAPLPAPLVGNGISAHDFGSGVVGNQVTLDSPSFFTLAWANPLGAASDDYDLFLLDPTLANVVAASTTTQNGTQDPFEAIDSEVSNDLNNRVVVTLFGGNSVFFHLSTQRGRLDIGTDGQIYGHAAAENAVAVAAVRALLAGAFTGGPANPVEEFSSDGPRIIFFNADGSPVNVRGANSIVRQKPDIAAANGVSTASSNFGTFFGTSASAPHAAGIAALFNELFPSIPVDGAIDIFKSSALDIDALGIDVNSGNGIIMADEALGTPIFVDGFESGNTSAWTK